jgi:hypothetical protein
VIVSIMFFACSIGMAVTGKAAVRGHHGVFITPQNDPWGFWEGVVICFVVAVIAQIVSIRALIEASRRHALARCRPRYRRARQPEVDPAAWRAGRAISPSISSQRLPVSSLCHRVSSPCHPFVTNGIDW